MGEDFEVVPDEDDPTGGQEDYSPESPWND